MVSRCSQLADLGVLAEQAAINAARPGGGNEYLAMKDNTSLCTSTVVVHLRESLPPQRRSAPLNSLVGRFYLSMTAKNTGPTSPP